MNTPDEEQYVFLRLADNDIAKALAILQLIRGSSNEQIQLALLKQAVIAYCRPFKTSYGTHTKRHQLPVSVVPAPMAALHVELETLRDEEFAHTDLSALTPKLIPHFMFGDTSTFPILRRTATGPSLMKRLPDLTALFEHVLDAVMTKAKTLATSLGGQSSSWA